jgi:hypothetical protein
MSGIIFQLRLFLDSQSEFLNEVVGSPLDTPSDKMFRLFWLHLFWLDGCPQGVRDRIVELATHPATASPNARLVSRHWKREHDRQVTVLKLPVHLAFIRRSGCSTEADCKFETGNMYATPWEVQSLRAFPNLIELHCELNVTSFDMSDPDTYALNTQHMFPYSFLYSLRGFFPHLKVLDVQIVDESPPTCDCATSMYSGVPHNHCTVSLNSWPTLHTKIFRPDVPLFSEFINALPKFFGSQLETFHLPTLAMVSVLPHERTPTVVVGPVFCMSDVLSVVAASPVNCRLKFLAYESDVRTVQGTLAWRSPRIPCKGIQYQSTQAYPSDARQYQLEDESKAMVLWSVNFHSRWL